MDELSHLFVSATEAQGRSRTKKRRISLSNKTTDEEVVLYFPDLKALIENWSYYAGSPASFLKNEAYTFSPAVQQVFLGLQEHLNANEVSDTYLLKQNEEFGVALQELRK